MQNSSSAPDLKQPQVSKRPLIIKKRDGVPLIVQRAKSTGNPTSTPEILPCEMSGDLELCPFCEAVSFPYEKLLNHIVTCHNFTDAVLQDMVRDGSQKCTKCGGITRTPLYAIKHACCHHSTEVIRILSRFDVDQWDNQTILIQAFLKKHEPEDGFGVVRTVPISSSASEDDEDEPNEDGEYLRFIASTVHSEGVVAGRKTDIGASKIQVRKEVDTDAQSFESVAEKLHNYECFLRTGDLIPNCAPFECRFCRGSFQSVTGLVAHYYTEHKLKISQEVKDILWVFQPDLPDGLSDSELLKYPSLALDLLLYSPVTQADNPRLELDLLIPSLMASFLVEFLAVGDIPFPRQTPKHFSEPTVLMIRIPAAIPVIFCDEEESGETRLGFISTPFLSAADIRERIRFVLDKLAEHNVLCAKFTRLDVIGFTDEDLIKMCEAYNVVVLKTADVKHDGGISRDFDVFITSKNITDKDLQNAILGTLTSLRSVAQLVTCRKCHALFNANNKVETCKPRRIGTAVLALQNSVHIADEKQTISTGMFNTDLLQTFL